MTVNLTSLPPHDNDSEAILLASVIIDSPCIAKVANFLKPEDFFNKRNEYIFSACLELYGESNKLDVALLADRLEASGKLDMVGGIGTLLEITNNELFISSSHVVKHSKAIKQASLRRKLIALSERSALYARDMTQVLPTTLGLVETELMRIGEEYNHSFGQTEVDFSLGLEGVLEMRSPGFKGYASGFDLLDEYTMRLKKGHLWLLYAKSAVGKTTISIQMARNVLREGGSVRFLSLEMSSKEIWNKLLQLEEATGLELGMAADAVNAYPGKLMVKDDIFTLNEIQRYIKQYTPVTDVFFIDYLPLIDSSRVTGKQLGEIETIIFNAREAQKMAKMNQACIVALAQSNTDNPNGRSEPWQENIKGGNSVKQVADVMVKLTRTITDKDLGSEKEHVTVYLQKNKFGQAYKECQYSVDKKTGGVIL